MTMLAEITTCVIGVDPDKARIHVAAIDSTTKGELGKESFVNNPDGHEAAMAWADAFAEGGDRAWAVEGSGSYGSRLTRSLQSAGEWVIDFSFPSGPAAANGAKSDHLDALRAGREVLGRTKLVTPRASQDGSHGAIRALTSARSGLVRSRTALINGLKATLMAGPETLIASLDDCSTPKLIKRCVRLRPDPNAGPICEIAATKLALRAQAHAIGELDARIGELTNAMTAHVTHIAPQLLDEPGVGTVNAAQLLVSWGHPGRIHNQAAWGKLSGTAPIEATSGQNQTRHRLSRGGDRALNRAIHTIAICRTQHDPRTRAYLAKKTNEGKNKREARRCLKRYIARHLYRLLEHPHPTP